MFCIKISPRKNFYENEHEWKFFFKNENLFESWKYKNDIEHFESLTYFLSRIKKLNDIDNKSKVKIDFTNQIDNYRNDLKNQGYLDESGANVNFVGINGREVDFDKFLILLHRDIQIKKQYELSVINKILRDTLKGVVFYQKVKNKHSKSTSDKKLNEITLDILGFFASIFILSTFLGFFFWLLEKFS